MVSRLLSIGAAICFALPLSKRAVGSNMRMDVNCMDGWLDHLSLGGLDQSLNNHDDTSRQSGR